MEEIREYVLSTAFAAAVAGAIACSFARGVNELSVVGEVSAIEQLRSDVKCSTVGSNEDVIGQAVEWNQKISSRKAYRKTLVGRVLLPKSWESVELIELP